MLCPCVTDARLWNEQRGSALSLKFRILLPGNPCFFHVVTQNPYGFWKALCLLPSHFPRYFRLCAKNRWVEFDGFVRVWLFQLSGPILLHFVVSLLYSLVLKTSPALETVFLDQGGKGKNYKNTEIRVPKGNPSGSWHQKTKSWDYNTCRNNCFRKSVPKQCRKQSVRCRTARCRTTWSMFRKRPPSSTTEMGFHCLKNGGWERIHVLLERPVFLRGYVGCGAGRVDTQRNSTASGVDFFLRRILEFS